jgi:hypothetical protein
VGRVALLQQQARDLGCGIVGVQEARTHGPDARPGEQYVAMVGGAEAGARGGECCVSTKHNFAPSGQPDIYIQRQDVVMAFHSPTAIVVAEP